MAGEKLFDDGPRSDSSPGRHTEKPFHFLNRRAGAFWDRVRNHLQTCYAAFPDEHKPGLVSRLRDEDERQHLPAWWELYVFTLFDRLGYAVKVHPDLTGNTGKNTRPDFLVAKGPFSMYVEAAFIFNADPTSDAWNWVCDCVNDAKNSDFMVDLEITAEGKQRPAKREIVEPLEAWLRTLDYDRALADQTAGRALPHWQLPARDWVLSLTAGPVRPDRRGIPGRLIAIYPMIPANFTRDVERLRNTLSKKGGKYGTLDQQLDRPLVVAIGCWNSIDEFELVNALFGSDALEISWDGQSAPRRVRRRDGYWRPGAEPRGSRISAVLFGDTMRAWTVASGLPPLWVNPWPFNPLGQPLPFASVNVGDSGNLVRTEASTTAAELFGLSPEWPNESALNS
ncbi:hypothetical protein [[Mycobacterium] holstebronense]|uniref:Uncharacterized protein n=1 Tax=[Mycobacterium] holstebronense TaxID=3064288 RepID=A0ABM9M0P9_9MYCO|nr:hypothetical protein [Mycolicibacter sp. MU0102]CAJ1508104.1 hypothetical protein MU0102_003295 [Mycolicibacter sp. MU0102]